MKLDSIDLFEVNEAFASVPLAWLKQTGADPQKTGMSMAAPSPWDIHWVRGGTKLMATLVHAWRARKKKYGLQTMCEGRCMAKRDDRGSAVVF